MKGAVSSIVSSRERALTPFRDLEEGRLLQTLLRFASVTPTEHS